jgi:CheY-specific phosphatase CheX
MNKNNSKEVIKRMIKLVMIGMIGGITGSIIYYTIKVYII